MPIGDVCPDVMVDLDDGGVVTGMVGFVIVEAPEARCQHVQLIATESMSGLLMRGLVEVGRDILISDQRETQQ